ncbi:MAG: protein translocase subunit SecF [Candidatus Berkelbacteria bacterium]|nr:protein translocase subunit SecF [Candidatus Berkelbacteria bacterium]
MFNIVAKRKYFYLISSLAIIASIFAVIFWKLNFGVDFRGGSVVEISAPGLANQQDKILQAGGDSEISIDSLTTSGSDKIIIRTGSLSTAKHDKFLANIKKDAGANAAEDSYQNVGPVVSHDLTVKAIWAVIIASIAIIFYVAYAFRKVPKPASSWRFGVTAVVALIHDLIITTGFVAVVGHFYSFMQVDSLFITALLTIMGFSVHDTIVVFDRLRENLIRHPKNDLASLANDSILQTISRSINTSITTILVLTALFVLGGSSISHFVLTLIAGITFGTYSSIFIATMLLISWDRNQIKN